MTLGCASHVQSSSGAGAAKLMLAASTTVLPFSTLRASLNVTGTAPEAELSVSRSLSPHCYAARNGKPMALEVRIYHGFIMIYHDLSWRSWQMQVTTYSTYYMVAF